MILSKVLSLILEVVVGIEIKPMRQITKTQSPRKRFREGLKYQMDGFCIIDSVFVITILTDTSV